MSYKYWLPDENGNRIEQFSCCNSVILIGANGAGKSHLGAWIEQQDLPNVHRIGAQRKLSFNDNIPLKSYSQAENLVLYGNDTHLGKENKFFKYGSPNEGMFTLKLVDDFDDVLSAIIAKKTNESDSYLNDCKKAEEIGAVYPHTPVTVIDKLTSIWNDIFPQRKLILEDSKFRAVHQIDINAENKYSATKMSDGERSVLYFAAQVLCVPDNKILIVDEPELHLHKSLMNRLWTTLEEYRQDCLFIYITHDTQFASLHSHADKIWIKEYNGKSKWKWEKVVDSDLPEDLLLDVLGNRKPVLFVEGEKNSFDTQLYSAIYKDYYVVACGSCSQVIARTKAFRNNTMLHHIAAYGIIDRDYRSDYEIEKYERDGIYTLQVAEVENLFIVEELVRAVATYIGCDPDVSFNKVYDFVVHQLFDKQIQMQICQSVVAVLKYTLNVAEISKKDEESAKESLNTLLNNINYDSVKSDIEKKFMDVKKSGDYKQIIKVFNEKGISKNIGRFIEGIDSRQYCQTVVNLVRRGNNAFIDSIINYLPDTNRIPR